ncbi:MAG: reverse transcriptase domain-containing protein [Stenomitos frigidus ULC029]
MQSHYASKQSPSLLTILPTPLEAASSRMAESGWKAKQGKSMEHSPLLMSAIFTLAALKVAWEKVRSNQGCAGVDGETIAHFTEQAERHLAYLEQALLTGTYRPMPLRQFCVPKKSGGWRILRVPTVRDRIVQQALLNALHPVLEPQFEDCSFAYRPGRSHNTNSLKTSYR